MISIYLQLKRLQRLESLHSCPKCNTNRTCAVYGTPGIINIYARPAGVEIAMESSAGHSELQPPTLPDPRRCPGRFQFPGRMDPVVTKAAWNGSEPTKTAAGNVTVLRKSIEEFINGFSICQDMDSLIKWHERNTPRDSFVKTIYFRKTSGN